LRVLITGGTGLLGKAILASAPPNYTIGFTYSKNYLTDFFPGVESFKVDLEDPDSLVQAIHKFEPTRIIHCAAMGSVDEAENQREKARRVNVEILKPLIELSNKENILFQLISTNAVYDGEHPPYNEKSERSSVNYYGALKIEAENFVSSECKKFVIIRPILLYGIPLQGRRDNPFSWIYNTLRMGKEIKLVDDVFTMPLLDSDCAKVCWEAGNFAGESFNVSGPNKLTLYDFALEIAEIFSLDPSLIKPIKSDTLKTIAPRPRDTSFDIMKIRKILNIEPLKTRDGLAKIKSQLNQ
jgi:dTDP-4-dehydrorhamnose reductase